MKCLEVVLNNHLVLTCMPLDSTDAMCDTNRADNAHRHRNHAGRAADPFSTGLTRVVRHVGQDGRIDSEAVLDRSPSGSTLASARNSFDHGTLDAGSGSLDEDSQRRSQGPWTVYDGLRGQTLFPRGRYPAHEEPALHSPWRAGPRGPGALPAVSQPALSLMHTFTFGATQPFVGIVSITSSPPSAVDIHP